MSKRVARWWPVVLLLLVPLLALWKGFTGLVPGPFDQLAQMAPFGGPAPAQPWDVLQADGVLQFYGWRDLVFSAWRDGRIPVWNPYQLAGTPLLANSQSAAFYPLHILAGLLHIPTGAALLVLAWFHLAWAGLGVRALVRALGGSETGAVVSGISFSLSPFLLAWTALPSVITTVSWIPWILAAIAVERPRFYRIAAIALPLGMMILSGHLQFVAYGLFATVAFGVLHILVLETKVRPSLAAKLDAEQLEIAQRSYGAGQRVGRLVGLGLAIGFGFALASAHLLPTLDYSQYSHRRNTPSEEGYAAYLGGALRPADLVSRISNPFGQGDPTQKVAEDAPFSQFWPALSRTGANYAESAGLTVGPLVLGLLVLYGLQRPRMRDWLPIGLVGVVSWLLALGTPLNRLLYFQVPGWSATGSPGRIAVLGVLAACVLGGLALREDRLPSIKGPVLAGIGALVSLLTLLPLVDAAPQGMAADAWSAISGAAATGAPVFLVTILLSSAGVYLFASRHPWANLAIVGAAVLIGAVPALRLVRMGDPSPLLKPGLEIGTEERVAFENEAWALVAAAPAIMPPNLATYARIHDLGGYDSLLHRDTVAMLSEINGQDSAPPANGNMMFIKPGADRAKLGEAGVTRLIRRIDGGIKSETIEGPGRASLSGGSAVLESTSTPNSIRVRVSGPGTLVVRDRALPGWTATHEGKALVLRPGRWLEVEAPAAGVVEFRYDPPKLETGLRLSLLAILLLVSVVLVSFRRRVTSEEGEQLEVSR